MAILPERFRNCRTNDVISTLIEKYNLSASSVATVLNTNRNVVIGRHDRWRNKKEKIILDLEQVFSPDEMQSINRLNKSTKPRNARLPGRKYVRSEVKDKKSRLSEQYADNRRPQVATLDDLFETSEPTIEVPQAPLIQYEMKPGGIVEVNGIEVHLYGDETVKRGPAPGSDYDVSGDEDGEPIAKTGVFNYTKRTRPPGGRLEELIPSYSNPTLLADLRDHHCRVVIGHDGQRNAYFCGAARSNNVRVATWCAYHGSYMAVKSSHRPSIVKNVSFPYDGLKLKKR